MRTREVPRDLEKRTRKSIRARLASGNPLKKEVAGDLGLSARSLDRELGRLGTSFRAEVDSVRRELAERRLAEHATTLSQVASDLGYSDPANFTRAFRRWTGQSPLGYRRRLGAK